MISLKKMINVCLQETGAFTRETENYTETKILEMQNRHTLGKIFYKSYIQ